MQEPAGINQRPLVAWQLAVNEFHRSLTTFESLQTTVSPRTTEELALMINPNQTILMNADGALNGWVTQCNERLKEKERTILQ
jgi:hypothetical protein